MSLRYTISKTKFSSVRFGHCQVCRQHAAEVFYQTVEAQWFPDNDEKAVLSARGIDKPEYWLEAGPALFGHESCLNGARLVAEAA